MCGVLSFFFFFGIEILSVYVFGLVGMRYTVAFVLFG